MKSLLVIILFLIVINGCNSDELITTPEFEDQSILKNTKMLDSEQLTRLEGIYNIVIGKEKFGKQVVLKINNNKVSIFGQKLGTYFILELGELKDEILLEGQWRYSQTEDVGLLRLKITQDNGANKVLTGEENNIIISGRFSQNDSDLSEDVSLEFVRTISSKILETEYFILAHRGGGRTTDNIGISENTLEMIDLAEQFGANGIEVDVKLSKDNIPFLYHDISLNLRTTKDSPIWGPIEDFTFKQINSFITLKYGEKIPSLEDALEYVIDHTNLKIVWLDMKSEKNSMEYVIPIQKKMIDKASRIGRDLRILIGIPDDSKFDNFTNYSNYKSIPSLCELDVSKFESANSTVWAPRWTLGYQTEIANQLRSDGKNVFTWTLDQSKFIEEYVNNSSFDGILTNYPTLVAYYFYVQE